MSEFLSRQAPEPKARRRVRIDGNDVLYHFLQKTLLESDFEQFRELAALLIAELGIWLPVSTYQRFPLLLAYAVRDPSCRGNRSKGQPDEWGSPNAGGYFRDDNSLIKGLPRGLPICNPSNPLLHRRFMGTSFVASHVWRELAGGGHASRDNLTYSFIPNLVWLPSQVSKLTDREGSYVQSYLQALSASIYKEVRLAPGLQKIVDPIWERLKVRDDVAGVPLPDPATLNYFEAGGDWLRRRTQTLQMVIGGLHKAREGQHPGRKIVSTRYTSGLVTISSEALESLLRWLTKYAAAIEGASSAHAESDAR